MAEAKQQFKGRVRSWLDRRRDAQRRAAENTARAKAVRRAETDRTDRHNLGGGSGGPHIGGF
jgi:hypothetical protein